MGTCYVLLSWLEGEGQCLKSVSSLPPVFELSVLDL